MTPSHVCESVLKIILWPHLGRVVRRSLDYILFVDQWNRKWQLHEQIETVLFSTITHWSLYQTMNRFNAHKRKQMRSQFKITLAPILPIITSLKKTQCCDKIFARLTATTVLDQWEGSMCWSVSVLTNRKRVLYGQCDVLANQDPGQLWSVLTSCATDCGRVVTMMGELRLIYLWGDSFGDCWH